MTTVCATAAYAAYRYAARSADTDELFRAWSAAQELTRQTRPLVRGTRNMVGGLIPLANLVLFPGDLTAAIDNYYESL